MGNMYPWTSGKSGKTINPLGGECPHKCKYCYVPHMVKIFHSIEKKYAGKIRLENNVLRKKIDGKGGTIFVSSMNDLFASEVPNEFIIKILKWTNSEPENNYLFQSKNPMRMKDYISFFPPKYVLGTTIESNIDYKISKAPSPLERYQGIKVLSELKLPIMISIEPILKFDLKLFTNWIADIHPNFISIGADSKNLDKSIPEPTSNEIIGLVLSLRKITDVRIKKNLIRLCPDLG
jgi:DNA repair photolyase